jgi:thioesterase domain-containing protein
MVPGTFVLLDRMPLTPNGKVDRRALPVPDHKSQQQGEHLVGPRDELERKLTRIWGKILGVQSISVTDNFFDLGGHSVLGSSMLTQVQKEFGKALSLTALFQAPTVEQLAVILRHRAWSSAAVLPLQTCGTELPFFAIHTRVGYRELSNELGSDQPFYVLPYDHLFDENTTRTLGDIARDLTKSLRAVQPEGPYYLGGMCLAGIVAFATAMELYDQGQEVALLAIMDAPAPGYRQKQSKWARLEYFFAAHVTFHARNLLRLPFKEKLAYVPKMFRTELLWHLKIRAWRLVYAAYRKMKLPLPSSLRDPFRLMGQAALGYKPAHRYAGPIAVFRPATRPVGRNLDLALGWGALVSGPMEVHYVPGGHRDLMVAPQVTHLGRKLKQCLLRAQAESSVATEKRELKQPA